MVSLEKFYEHMKVRFAIEEFEPKVRPLLDDVIIRLPDEPQFQTKGDIFFASKSRVIENLKTMEFPEYIISQWMVNGSDGQCVTKMASTGDIDSYYISIITNHFHAVCDDYIKGLIIHELLHMSYYWKVLQEKKPQIEKLSPKAKIVRLNQIGRTSVEIGSDAYDEKEKHVNAEAKRLGFEKEIDALEHDTYFNRISRTR